MKKVFSLILAVAMVISLVACGNQSAETSETTTSDADSYKVIMDEVRSRGVEVEIIPVKEPHVQRVWIEASEQNSFVDTLNRSGARLVLLDASPSREEALAWAEKLNIVVIDR